MASNNSPYIAPYANAFVDPITGDVLYVEIWNGGGWDRHNMDKPLPPNMKWTRGNPDQGYNDY